MNFRQLQQSDVEYMAENSYDKDFYKQVPAQTEFDYALEHDGDILGVGGFRMKNNTTAWCWFDLSTKAAEHTIVCYRVIKEWIEGYEGKDGHVPGFCETHGILRLEAYVKVGFEAGARTVEHLGFEWEHRMMKFIGQSPADRYVKYFDGDSKC